VTRPARNAADGLGFGVNVGPTLERWSIAGQASTLPLVTVAPGANTLQAIPFFSPWRGGRVDRISAEVTVGAAGNVRLGIYRATSLTDIYPGALIVDGGEADVTGAGVKTLNVDVPLWPGWLYWAVWHGAVAPTVRALDTSAGAIIPLLGVPSTFGANPGGYISVADAYGALPATFTAGGAVQTTDPPAIAIRFSA